MLRRLSNRAILLLCTAFLSLLHGGVMQAEIAVGDTVPCFSIRLSDGSLLHSSALRGCVSVIVFFDTDCGDCRRELPVVERVQQKVGRDTHFLCIARTEDAQQVARYWKQNGLTLPVATDAEKQVYSLFARHIIPRIYVCAKNGRFTALYARRAGLRSLLRAIRKAHKTS